MVMDQRPVVAEPVSGAVACATGMFPQPQGPSSPGPRWYLLLP
jgi:hypothetical protein